MQVPAPLGAASCIDPPHPCKNPMRSFRIPVILPSTFSELRDTSRMVRYLTLYTIQAHGTGDYVETEDATCATMSCKISVPVSRATTRS